jgi:DNA mismatch repair protein MutL
VVDNKLLEKSIAAAYKEMLFEGRCPAAVLFLDLPPASVDVNIHPAKNEVRFENDTAVFDFVSGAARKILRTRGAIPVIKADGLFKSGAGAGEDGAAASGADTGSSPKFPAPAAAPGAIRITDVNGPGAELRAGQISVKEFFSAKRKEEEGKETGDLIMEEEDSRESAGWSKRPFAIEDIRVTGAVFATFLTGVDEDSFYFIDQHAAHERVFYERLTKQHRSGEKLVQQLMTPFVIELPYAVKNDAAGLMDTVSAMGFSIEEFGPRSCVVKAIPAFIQISEARDFLDSALGSLSGETSAENARMTERIIMDSCKKAVKAGDRLKPEEIENLLKELARCDNPYSCPHGRPVFVRMRKHDIEKMFKRV